MSVEPHDSNDEFIERIARPLRAPERFGDDFEDALVAAIREDPTTERQQRAVRRFALAWWSVPSIRLSPLAALAIAASLMAVASLVSVRQATSRDRPVPVATVAAVRDTVTLVRFVFVGQADSVALVGDFNAWGATPTHLRSGRNGAWTASVPLSKGRHEYAFIVNGKRWMPDPFAPTNPDEFEANSSVITIGD